MTPFELIPVEMISLEDVYFGNTIIQYLQFFGVILASLIIGRIILFIIQNHFKKLTEKTHTKVDDLIIYTVEKPIHLTFLVLGIYVGLMFLTPDAEIFSTIHNILKILFFINLGWYAVRLSDAVLDAYVVPLTKKSESKLDDQLIPIIRNAVKYVIIILSALIILDNVGFDVTTLLAGLGIGGLALAMASQDAVSNVFGGFTIFTDKPFTLGDWIKFEGFSGTVEEVGIRSSRLRTFDGALVTFPNNMFSKHPIENMSKRPSERVVMRLGFTYDTPVKKMEQAKQIIKEIISTTKGVDNKKMYISFEEFGDFALKFLVIYYINDMSTYERRLEIRDEVNMKIKEMTEKAKIEMAFPTQTIFHKKL